jgi:hypothetical protein
LKDDCDADADDSDGDGSHSDGSESHEKPHGGKRQLLKAGMREYTGASRGGYRFCFVSSKKVPSTWAVLQGSLPFPSHVDLIYDL